MYTSPDALILAFHGCDRGVGERILRGETSHLNRSENAYDWLGYGIYFWENNPERALEFAIELRKHPRPGKPVINEPFVIGAVIDPGHCLNLLESESLQIVYNSYLELRRICSVGGVNLPTNKPDKKTGELLRRELDCAVIETIHKLNTATQFDTVRGVFEEGAPLYPGAGFRAKTHVQLCVRNEAKIKGYLRLLSNS